MFEDKRRKIDRDKYQEQEELVDRLYKLVGQRDIELDWLKKNYQSLTMTDKLNLVDRGNTEISLSRQAEIPGLSRSRLYYKTKVSEKDLLPMNLIDEIYTNNPSYLFFHFSQSGISSVCFEPHPRRIMSDEVHIRYQIGRAHV